MTPAAPPVKERHAAAKANSPEEQNAVRKEISAAQQAGNAATGKYRRGMEFLRSVQARRGETPAP